MDIIRHTVGINQNQGGTIYPFAEECVLGGVIKDLRVLVPRPVVGNLYLTIDDPGLFGNAEVPRLFFYDDLGLMFHTETAVAQSISTRISSGHRWLRWQSILGKYYVDILYDWGTPIAQLLLSTPAKLVSRCWEEYARPIQYQSPNLNINQTYYRHFLTLTPGPDIEHDAPLPALSDRANWEPSKIKITTEGNTITITDIEDEQEEEHALLSINQKTRDLHGNLAIKGDNDCIVVAGEKVIDNVLFFPTQDWFYTNPPDTVTFRNDCSECCSCQDYVMWFHELNELIRQHNRDLEFLAYLMEYYQALYERYERILDIKMLNLLRLRCDSNKYYMSVSLGVSNPSNTPKEDVVVNLNFENLTNDSKGSIKNSYVYDVTCEGEWPKYTITIPKLLSHSSWTGALIVEFPTCDQQIKVTMDSNLPWCDREVECVTDMLCNRQQSDVLCDAIGMWEEIESSIPSISTPSRPI